jgi:hypothetical protein
MKLFNPLPQDSGGTNDQNRASKLFGISQASEKGNHLNGLAQTHFIAQNTTDLLNVD